MSKRWAVIISAVSLLLGICAVPAVAGQGALGDGRPDNGFSQNGPWNTKLPPNVPLAPNSAAIVANIALDQANNFGIWGLNTESYSTPLFYVGRDTPVQNWTYSDCRNLPQLAPVLAPSLHDVPTPANLFASEGTDEVTTIYLPLAAGVIRISELQRGYIDHAIILVVPRTQANCFSWPANRDDGNTARRTHGSTRRPTAA